MERLPLCQTNRPVDVIKYWHESGEMLLDPPYQRGDVWGMKRRRNFIKSICLGLPLPAIIINGRINTRSVQWEKEIFCVVIDGKQRITTILMFFNDQLDVPGEWFGMEKDMVFFSDLEIREQRFFKNYGIPFSEGQLKSIEAEKEVFELVNFGGVPQGEKDE